MSSDLFPRIAVKVPEWDCEVEVRAPSLAELRANHQPSDPDLADDEAREAIVDSNIRLLVTVATPPRPFEAYLSELPELRLRELLRALAEVSGVTSGDQFRPPSDV